MTGETLTQHLRVGIASGGLLCLGAYPPVKVELVNEVFPEQSVAFFQLNAGGDQIVALKPEGFGDDDQRYENFEACVQTLGQRIVEEAGCGLRLDLDPQVLLRNQESLFGDIQIPA